MTGVYDTASPVYILIGDADDWTPAENCRKLAEAARKAGHPVELKVYAGAHHSFDSDSPVRYVASRVNANAPGRRGATTGGQPAAWADSIREVAGFFGRHLGRTP
jgi:dienelactone hydrolase